MAFVLMWILVRVFSVQKVMYAKTAPVSQPTHVLAFNAQKALFVIVVPALQLIHVPA